ncbi:uncharacterized protein C8A04DRAFT_33093 [Dichotomopilus funicola]|uniref:Geranylgeranyl transferase type-2 subunit alpha n=1 Tax=Dichotomopilus funicola TaxID=1934379 RepID=A0AAN6UUD9_9PEZI|nr:hypothetical protein C8A04DRAFT_33093 [Dichotomopilus funicola]
MADHGGSQHGIARTSRVRTEEQRQRDLGRIAKYRELEDQARALASRGEHSTPELFQITTKLLRLNPEYYTIWNARRRCLISGSFSNSSAGSSRSKGSSTTSATPNTAPSSAKCSSPSSATTPPGPGPQTAGKSGTTADDAGDEASNPIENHEATPTPAEAKAPAAEATQTTEATEAQDLSVIKSELAFTIPLLLESPKCYWIWSYRLWILEQAIARLPARQARKVWEEELGLVSMMLGRDRRNFHAWGYRRHVVDQLESTALHGSSMVETEFAYTDSMIKTDLSNFSAWHRRSRLIPRLLEERGADAQTRREFFNQELELIHNALNVGPEDQSLWYYHQFLVLNLVSPNQPNPTTPSQALIVPDLPLADRIGYLTSEINLIDELLEDYDDVKSIYEALFEYRLYQTQLEGRQPDEREKEELARWLGKLKQLDPMRSGRWADLEKEVGLGVYM